MDLATDSEISQRRTASPHSLDSSLREQALAHIFLGQLLSHMWRSGRHDIEVLKSEVDRHGYDVVLESDGIVRHIQLKSRFRGSTVSQVDINTKLLAKPGGCVIWIEFESETLSLEKFYWFGGAPGTPLPALGNRASKHSKGNAFGEKLEKPLHRVLGKGRFDVLDAMPAVVTRLFG